VAAYARKNGQPADDRLILGGSEGQVQEAVRCRGDIDKNLFVDFAAATRIREDIESVQDRPSVRKDIEQPARLTAFLWLETVLNFGEIEMEFVDSGLERNVILKVAGPRRLAQVGVFGALESGLGSGDDLAAFVIAVAFPYLAGPIDVPFLRVG